MENIKRMEACKTFEELMREVFRIRSLQVSGHPYLKMDRCGDFYEVEGNVFHKTDAPARKDCCLSFPYFGWCWKDLNFIYFDQEGKCWESERLNASHCRIDENDRDCIEVDMSGFKFRARRKLYPFISQNFLINTKESLMGMLRKANPYAAGYLEENPHLEPSRFLQCPALEILHKAGYAFADVVAIERPSVYGADGTLAMFDRLVRYDGKNPKDILKTTGMVARVLKDEEDLAVWDTIRKMVKKYPAISADELKMITEGGFTRHGVKLFYEILGWTHNGSALFTIRSLLAYLDRLDRYEAIEGEERLGLLRDYLSLCRQVGMEPKVDGDSLKREHDIAARIHRQMVMEKGAGGIPPEEFAEAARKNAAYDYEEEVFFVRAVRTQSELNDEGKQQHNCVSCYAKDIVDGKSAIYVVRYKRSPDKSLVTADVREGVIVSYYHKYNVKVRSRAILDFMKRWQRYIFNIRTGEATEEAV